MSGNLGQVVFAFFEDHLKIQKGLRPGSIRSYRPRGTPENRPMRDTSKPANGREAGQALLYPTCGGTGKFFAPS